jgi:cytochrome c-type biogenesis protein CcmE
MSWLPKSRTARRRLTILAVIAPVLAIAVGLSLYGLRSSISFFYTPSQAQAAHVPPGRSIQLGGLVLAGSVARHPDGRVDFVVSDARGRSPVAYSGDLPDLFREGQGVVAIGSYDAGGLFHATQILAKHDERYMPRDLANALRAQGEWRGGGATPTYARPTASPPAAAATASSGTAR